MYSINVNIVHYIGTMDAWIADSNGDLILTSGVRIPVSIGSLCGCERLTTTLAQITRRWSTDTHWLVVLRANHLYAVYSCLPNKKL